MTPQTRRQLALGLGLATAVAAAALARRKLAASGQARPPAPAVPPGPPAYPILGTLPRGDLPQHERVLQLWRQFGDVVYLRVGSRALYLISSPDDIKHVLQDNNQNYTKGRGLQKAKLFLGDGLLTNEGDAWRRQRRLIQPAFHRQRIAAFADTMTRATAGMLDRWRQLPGGRPLNVANEMMRLTLDIVAQTLFSTALTPAEMDAVADVMPRVLLETSDRVTRPFEIRERLPLPANRRFFADLATLDGIVYRIIQARRDAPATDGDLLGMLMAARDEENGEGMSDRQLRDEVMTLFLAGHETTANLLTWTWYLLSMHPNVRQQLHAEVDAVLQGRTPTADDVRLLPYTSQVLHEALRLYPPAAIFSRTAQAEDELSGYTIPAGSIVLISPYVMHRHPAYWENPAGFDPDRFAPGWERRVPRMAYIPFGAGPRLCIGNNFALLEAALILAMVSQRAALDAVPGHPVEAELAITLRPKQGVLMDLGWR